MTPPYVPDTQKDPPGWWTPVSADQSMVTEGGTHLTLAVVMERGAPPPYSTQVPRLAERRRYWRSAPSFSSKEAGVPSTRAMRSLDIPPQTHSCHQPAGARLGRRVRSNWLGGGVVYGQQLKSPTSLLDDRLSAYEYHEFESRYKHLKIENFPA
ncbi:hypothetical protein CTAM01_03054 [Colletotrichum tamarilloi]|uniref:Uncharacterized protein n=1 Tax=Colletotrichum tamarilloi TaxID=1209934 RepID=A0ABQ9RLN3_9PEZI|nr:uncharacterized protein CTAM01_03054 [Colletotrichum tamarilloi]KAK1506722.1 hypothetical protein CTAM01_03054 [Colletotrichum tamarilloi]